MNQYDEVMLRIESLDIKAKHTDTDLVPVSRIFQRSWQKAYKGMIPDRYLDHLQPDGWVSNLQELHRRTLVLIDNDEYVGVCCYGPTRDEQIQDAIGGEIIALYLLPEYMHHGYGRYLILAAQKALRQMGYTLVCLWVLKDNMSARSFYEKNGFVQSVFSKKEDIGGWICEELLYIKDIWDLSC